MTERLFLREPTDFDWSATISVAWIRATEDACAPVQHGLNGEHDDEL
jgi:hypothetical protein